MMRRPARSWSCKQRWDEEAKACRELADKLVRCPERGSTGRNRFQHVPAAARLAAKPAPDQKPRVSTPGLSQ